MKLFIKPQDKTDLEGVNEVHLDELKIPNRKTRFSIVANSLLLGKYPTRKRCLEIIDDIENRLMSDADFVLYTMPEK